MINHAEAQSLVSARMDEPLDPIVARELDAHLATCPQCRAFAAKTTALSQALHDLPRLPASPRVRREVLDTVRKPQTPWTRFQGIFAPGPGPALSTVAAILVVGILSVFVLTRLLGDHDSGGDQTTLLAPSIETTRNADVAQANPTVTATTAATDSETVPPAPTEPANAVSTTEPTQPENQPASQPTDPPAAPPTSAPTEPPAPTEPATEPPSQDAGPTSPPTEQTARTDAGENGSNAIRIAGEAAGSPEATTLVPTETPIPTETSAPTETPAPTETVAPVETVAPTETIPPTETPVPAETVAPTDEPTAPPEPTETAIATEASETPTAPPAPTSTQESPPIESTTGTYVPAEGDTTPADEPTTTEPTSPVEPPEATTAPGGLIEPAGTAIAPDTGPTIAPAFETPGNQQSVPNDGTGGATTDVPPSGQPSPTTGEGHSSDPGRSLGTVDAGARIEASGGSWAPVGDTAAPQVSADGLTIGSDQEGRLAVCDSAGACQTVVTDHEGRGSLQGIGWIGSSLVYEETSSDGFATYHEVNVNPDGTVGEDRVLGSGATATGTSYVFGDGLLIETQSGWFSTSTGLAVTSDPPVSNRQLVRLYPERGFVVSLSDGNIIVENVNNGAITARVATSGSDFDLSAEDQLVVSTGSAIEIWDLYGGKVATYTPPSGHSVGSVAWTGTDILYVDTSTGEVRIISPSDFGPGTT